jgi:hypothetical protein
VPQFRRGTRDRLAGTTWRAFRPIFFFLLLVAAGFFIIAGGVAVTTADRCGELRAAKEWQWLPPHWECR